MAQVQPLPKPRLVTTPRERCVTVIDDQVGLHRFIDEIDPTAPIAIDAERAQSFRYSAKAYLIQFHQSGCGTRLLDPVALAQPGELADLSILDDALASCQWVLHAASQDLPGLAEVGLTPRSLFDTELGGRLLGFEKVSLSPMLAHYLGIELAKAHSADDWSARPLPVSWLIYAALDVDYLLELRDAVAEDLANAGKADWAEQEFACAMDRFALAPAFDPERWRTTKGIGVLRQPRQLGIARSLWQLRDSFARQLDMYSGRILSDAALVEASVSLARLQPEQVASTINKLPGFTGPLAKRQKDTWTSAVIAAMQLDTSQLPTRTVRNTVPSHRVWPQLNKLAAQRWDIARPLINQVAAKNNLPPENLMTVATLAQVLWRDNLDTSEVGLRQAMAQTDTRPWQQDLLAPALAQALASS